MPVRPSLFQLPQVIDINIIITQIPHPVRDHRFRRFDNQSLRQVLTESIPTVPSHHRGQRQFFAYLYFQLAHPASLLILGYDLYLVLPGILHDSPYDSSFGIQSQPLR